LLAACLSKAVSEPELVTDITEACELSGITVQALASGEIDAPTVAERLFLTEDEAARLLYECKKALYGDDVHHHEEHFIAFETIPEDSESHRPTDDSWPDAVKGPQDGGDFETPHASPRQTNDADLEKIPTEFPGQAVCKLGVSGPPNKALTTLRHSQAFTPSAQPSKTLVSPGPKRLAQSAVFSPSELMGTNSPRSSMQHLPSYLRPTASAQARSKTGPVSPAPVEPLNKPEQKKKKNILSRISSTLFAPTSAFLARVTGSNPAKEKAQQQSLRQSQMLKEVMESPQGQRVTKIRPFNFVVASRPKTAPQLTTEEAAFVEEQKKTFKKNAVPKHVHEARPLEFRAASSPKKPEEVFQPFQLASLQRHAKFQEKKSEELAAVKVKEEEAKNFKASGLDKTMMEKPLTPRKPEPKAVTKAQGPAFKSEERIAHYRNVVLPAKRAKMSAAEREKLEKAEREAAEAERQAAAEKERTEAEKAREKELEDLTVKELRKSMVFKARAMPDFSSPFRPDPAKAASVTTSQEFNFKTDSRLGKSLVLSAREDRALHRLGSGRFDGTGFVDPFMNSLRHSVQVPSPRSPGGSNLRKSTNSLSLSMAGLGRSPGARHLAARSSLSSSMKLEAALSSALSAVNGEMQGGVNSPSSSHMAGTSVSSPRMVVAAV